GRGTELVPNPTIGIGNDVQVVVNRWAGLLPILCSGLAEGREPRLVRAQPPRGEQRHRFTGSLGLISQVPVPELRVITMGIEENIGPVRLGDVGFWDWRCQQPVAGLAGELQYPTRHRHRHPVGGELSYERVGTIDQQASPATDTPR